MGVHTWSLFKLPINMRQLVLDGRVQSKAKSSHTLAYMALVWINVWLPLGSRNTEGQFAHTCDCLGSPESQPSSDLRGLGCCLGEKELILLRKCLFRNIARFNFPSRQSRCAFQRASGHLPDVLWVLHVSWIEGMRKGDQWNQENLPSLHFGVPGHSLVNSCLLEHALAQFVLDFPQPFPVWLLLKWPSRISSSHAG